MLLPFQFRFCQRRQTAMRVWKPRALRTAQHVAPSANETTWRPRQRVGATAREQKQPEGDVRGGARAATPPLRHRRVAAKSRATQPLRHRRVAAKSSAKSTGATSHGKVASPSLGRQTKFARTKPAAKKKASKKSLGKPAHDVVAAMVGNIQETRDEHVKRCSNKQCPRCRWYLKGHVWQGTYGSLTPPTAMSGARERVIWLEERPVRWGGTWALGCSLCAAALWKRQSQTAPVQHRGVPSDRSRKSTPRTRCKWALYEARPVSVQAEHIKQHACSDTHKLAVQAHLRPEEPVRLALQRTRDDDSLLSGAVPQVVDWLRVWRWAREGDTWASAERKAHTEHWVDQIRDRDAGVKRKAIRSMAFVMREVIRAKKRQHVKAATCISISFDDRKAHKLVTFNCDTKVPLQHRGVLDQQPWVSGVVGCLDKVHGESLSSMDDDYAERTCVKVMEIIEQFCTPMGETLRDEAVYGKFIKATRSIVVDGALLKAAVLLRERFLHNVIIICRDPAHCVRTAVSEPWVRMPAFEEQHRTLFSGRHALLADVQHSDALQARLQACQADVVAERGSQGGGVVSILRHFSFAPHRWESFAAPRRQYCCMLIAIFKCLGAIAGDWRMEKAKRDRAEKCMDAMCGRHAVEIGVAADYAELCMRFIRQWDSPDRDPATATRILNDFRENVRVLFVEGYILCDPETTPPRHRGVSNEALKTISQIVFEQLLEGVDIDVNGETKRLWGATSKSAILSVMADVKSAVAAMLDRLDADFASNSLYLCFEAFDLDAWRPLLKADRDNPDGENASAKESVRRLLAKGEHLFKSMGCEWNAERFVVAVRAAAACSVDATTPQHMRNRALWAAALASSRSALAPPQGASGNAAQASTGGPSVTAGCSPAATLALRWAEPVANFYFSFRDGTGDVERSLGKHTAMAVCHPSSTRKAEQRDDSAEVCMELAQEGPQHERDVAAKPEVAGGPMLLTDWSRECARVWRSQFGARFSCQYAPRRDVGRRNPDRLEGTLTRVKVQHKAATNELLEIAAADKSGDAAEARGRRTIFGFRRSDISNASAPPRGADHGKRMRDFCKRTQDIVQEKTKHRIWTGCATVVNLRRKEKLAKQPTAREKLAKVRKVVEKAAQKFARLKNRAKPKQGPAMAGPALVSSTRVSAPPRDAPSTPSGSASQGVGQTQPPSESTAAILRRTCASPRGAPTKPKYSAASSWTSAPPRGAPTKQVRFATSSSSTKARFATHTPSWTSAPARGAPTKQVRFATSSSSNGPVQPLKRQRVAHELKRVPDIVAQFSRVWNSRKAMKNMVVSALSQSQQTLA